MLFKCLKRSKMFLTGQWKENNVLHFLFYFPEAIIREKSQSFRNHVCSQAVPDGSIHSHVSLEAACHPWNFPAAQDFRDVRASWIEVPWLSARYLIKEGRDNTIIFARRHFRATLPHHGCQTAPGSSVKCIGVNENPVNSSWTNTVYERLRPL